MRKIVVFDSTLRDGAQAADISFSVQDKLRIAQVLDSLGVDRIECGNPGSNPKDLEFFEKLRETPLSHAEPVAFGSTRRRGVCAEDDPNLKALAGAGTPVVAVFGKAWDAQVRRVLRASLAENLRMIRDSVSFLRAAGKEVVFDAEHFFDGYRENPSYALRVLEAAAESGASRLCLCDTRGGSFPDFIAAAVGETAGRFPGLVGIHAHDDGGMAVAGSVMAVEAGAVEVQGTLAGFGERCGNANLAAVIANLQLKRGYSCIPPENMKLLTQAVRAVEDTANVAARPEMPFVGGHAFLHKAGMHVDGVMKDPRAYEHVDPEAVGNVRRFMLSEVSGRSAVLAKARAFFPEIRRDSSEAAQIVAMVKRMEQEGYQFEGADASFELEVRRMLGRSRKFFELEMLSVVDEQRAGLGYSPACATIKVLVNGKREITAAEGDGPVNAIDRALRKALEVFYPEIGGVRLHDYKVRVLDSGAATAARVRVLIETTDGREYWSTVGVAVDIIEASCRALLDSVEYRLMKTRGEKPLPAGTPV